MTAQGPLTRDASACSRRHFITELGLAGGAMVLSGLGCSPAKRSGSSCLAVGIDTVRWLVPFPPGGGYDIYARLLEPHFERTLGVGIAIENMPGAGGMVAATALKHARPDGSVLGIVNAPGLLIASMTGATGAPDPARDFTILGRVSRTRSVLVTGAASGWRTIADVVSAARTQPILIGTSEISSTNFVNAAVAASLLGIDHEFISGFQGSRETSMAAIRGEIDLFSGTFESSLGLIEVGDLIPLVQLSAERLSPHPALDGVPLLGGKEGVAVRRARELNRDPSRAELDTADVLRLSGTGVLVAAPPHLNDGVLRCLEQRLSDALTDPGFQSDAARAQRSLDVARAHDALADLTAAAKLVPRVLPYVREALRRMR
jgi:tripartite-type tricarboxylate transporter receptor subunit TctC